MFYLSNFKEILGSPQNKIVSCAILKYFFWVAHKMNVGLYINQYIQK